MKELTRGCAKYSTEHESSSIRIFFGAAARLAGSVRPILALVFYGQQTSCVHLEGTVLFSEGVLVCAPAAG